MVESMKPGSVIVDIAADSGGNCALTKPGERWTTPNGSASWLHQLARAASPPPSSALYARNLLTFLTTFWDKEAGAPKLRPEDEIVRGVMLTRGGQVCIRRWRSRPRPLEESVRYESH
jgi:NAD(P) transhydrogenase subunit alpha